mmetsp:Transcript_3655/g.4857  ORF Transcript_3655/g.4857 Transcript_3655/m.4857 type:complete len:1854 (+) Transcript_3655:78-5639(+)
MDERRRKQIEYHQYLDAQVRERQMQAEMNRTNRKPTHNSPLPPMAPKQQKPHQQQQNPQYPVTKNQPQYQVPTNNVPDNNLFLPQVPHVSNMDNGELARLSEEVRNDKSRLESVLRSHQRDNEVLSSLKERIHHLENANAEFKANREANDLRLKLSNDQRSDIVNTFRNELDELKHELSLEKNARKQDTHRMNNELELIKTESIEKIRLVQDKVITLEEELHREKERNSLLETRLTSRISATEDVVGKLSYNINDNHIKDRIDQLENAIRKDRDQHKNGMSDIAKNIAITRNSIENQLKESNQNIKMIQDQNIQSEKINNEHLIKTMINDVEDKINNKIQKAKEERRNDVETMIENSIEQLKNNHKTIHRRYDNSIDELKRVLSAEIAARQGKTRLMEKQISDFVELKKTEQGGDQVNRSEDAAFQMMKKNEGSNPQQQFEAVIFEFEKKMDKKIENQIETSLKENNQNQYPLWEESVLKKIPSKSTPMNEQTNESSKKKKPSLGFFGSSSKKNFDNGNDDNDTMNKKEDLNLNEMKAIHDEINKLNEQMLKLKESREMDIHKLNEKLNEKEKQEEEEEEEEIYKISKRKDSSQKKLLPPSPPLNDEDRNEIEILREEVNDCIKLTEEGLASLDQAKLLILEQSLQLKSNKNMENDNLLKENQKQLDVLKKSFEIGLLKSSEELAFISSQAINDAKKAAQKSEKSSQECEMLIETYSEKHAKELNLMKELIDDFHEDMKDTKDNLETSLANESNTMRDSLANESNAMRALMRAMVGGENAERLRCEARQLDDLEVKLSSLMEKVQLEVQFSAQETLEKAEASLNKKFSEFEKNSKTEHEIILSSKKQIENNKLIMNKEIDDIKIKSEVSNVLNSLINKIADEDSSFEVNNIYQSVIGIGYGALTSLHHIDIARQEAADYCEEEELERQEDIKFLSEKIHETEQCNEIILKNMKKDKDQHNRLQESLIKEMKLYVIRKVKEESLKHHNNMYEIEQEVIELEERLHIRSTVEGVLHGMVDAIASASGSISNNMNHDHHDAYRSQISFQRPHQAPLPQPLSTGSSFLKEELAQGDIHRDRISSQESSDSIRPSRQVIPIPTKKQVADKMENQNGVTKTPLSVQSSSSEESPLVNLLPHSKRSSGSSSSTPSAVGRSPIGERTYTFESHLSSPVSKTTSANPTHRTFESSPARSKESSANPTNRTYESHFSSKETSTNPTSRDIKDPDDTSKDDVSIGSVISSGNGKNLSSINDDVSGGDSIPDSIPDSEHESIPDSIPDGGGESIDSLSNHSYHSEDQSRASVLPTVMEVQPPTTTTIVPAVVNNVPITPITAFNIEMHNKLMNEKLGNNKDTFPANILKSNSFDHKQMIQNELNKESSNGDKSSDIAEGEQSMMFDLSTSLGFIINANTIVVRVNPGEQADIRGLRKGCKITRISGSKVSTPQDFKIAIAACKHRNQKEIEISYVTSSGMKKMGTFVKVMKAKSKFMKNGKKQQNNHQEILKTDENSKGRNQSQRSSLDSSKNSAKILNTELSSDVMKNPDNNNNSTKIESIKIKSKEEEEEEEKLEINKFENIVKNRFSSREVSKDLEHDKDEEGRCYFNVMIPLGLIINPTAIIAKVTTGEQGERLGLKKGMKIIRIGEIDVSSLKDIQNVMGVYKKKENNHSVELVYLQPKSSFKTLRKVLNVKSLFSNNSNNNSNNNSMDIRNRGTADGGFGNSLDVKMDINDAKQIKSELMKMDEIKLDNNNKSSPSLRKSPTTKSGNVSTIKEEGEDNVKDNVRDNVEKDKDIKFLEIADEKEDEIFDEKMLTITYENEQDFVDLPSPASVPPLSMKSSTTKPGLPVFPSALRGRPKPL